jgi:hypothetical protein
MANGKTIRESFAKTELGFLGIKVFSSVLQLDVTHIEKKVRVLFAVARFSLFVLLVLRFFFCVFFVALFLTFSSFLLHSSAAFFVMISGGPAAFIANQAQEQMEPIKCPTLRTRSSSTST